MVKRVDFAARGTPLQRVDRLGEACGLPGGQLWVKRDDVTGLAGGGNKARKLEYLVADALSQGCDTLVTSGAAQSNHVRATAAAARGHGLECVAALSTSRGRHLAEGNLVLDDLLGVRVTWTGPEDRDARVAEIATELSRAGRRPYVIPLGGTNALGASGYVTAAEEIEAALPDAVVVCAAGTGGTLAGLAVGLGSYARVIGVDVAALPDLPDRIPPVVAATADLLGRAGPDGALMLDTGQAGSPYGAPTEAAEAAIRVTARSTGLILDPVYTGRAMAGLLEAARAGRLPDAPIVFLHSGGLPALFTARYQSWFRMPSQFEVG